MDEAEFEVRGRPSELLVTTPDGVTHVFSLQVHILRVGLTGTVNEQGAPEFSLDFKVDIVSKGVSP